MDDTLTLKEGSLNSIDEVKEMFPSCLKECELVRYILSGDNLRIFVVYDIEEEHHHDHEEEEEDGCCANLNGHLFSVLFHGVKDVVIKGEECDNYTLLKLMRIESLYLTKETTFMKRILSFLSPSLISLLKWRMRGKSHLRMCDTKLISH